MATKELTKCIVTGSDDLEPIINLGDIYPSAFIGSPQDEKKFKREPFVVNYCKVSGMVQLKYVHDYDDMFKEYWYRSGTNSQMKRALDDVVDKSISKCKCDVQNWLDIANNDGTLSQLVKERYGDDVFVVGVDPALDLKNKGNDVFVNDYFSVNVVNDAVKQWSRDNGQANGLPLAPKYDIITNIAMFYDLQDPHPFLDDVKKVLDKNGIFVIQMTDLWGMMKSSAVDNFCHEHVAYYSLEAMDKLLKFHQLEIFDFEYNTTNGSSLRLYVCHPGDYFRREFVDMMIEYQRPDVSKEKIKDWYENKIGRSLHVFSHKLAQLKAEGKHISIIGASTKGNTLLQLCDLNEKTIDNALEVLPFKFGKYCLGSNIPIVDEKSVLNSLHKPDVLVGMIWHFRDSLLRTFDRYMDEGGTIIFPLPTPVMYHKEHGTVVSKDIT